MRKYEYNDTVIYLDDLKEYKIRNWTSDFKQCNLLDVNSNWNYYQLQHFKIIENEYENWIPERKLITKQEFRKLKLQKINETP